MKNSTTSVAFLILAATVCAICLEGRAQHEAAGWQFESQRASIAPKFNIDNAIAFDGEPTLALSGGGKAYAAGYWHKTVPVKPGGYYLFRSHFISEKVDEPDRSILARVIWLDTKDEVVGFREYPATLRGLTDGWSVISQAYRVPSGAVKARLELHYRWDGDGKVNFGKTTFEATAPPAPRIVRLATVHHRPRNSESTEANLKKFATLVDEAGARRADIVCLPEGITLAGTQHDYISASEPVPGPTTNFLGGVARKNNLYIVAGILEKEGDVVYNTAVLIDRKGNLAGKYRKASLPREEIDGGITPGNSFPVFDTDFGRIGMMICWDVTFPEPARALARQGAEVILLPIWGGDLTLAKARAIENQVYLVSSTYDMISAVFDLEGKVVKEADDTTPVVVVEVNLAEQKLWPWLGDFRNRIPREIPSKEAIGRAGTP